MKKYILILLLSLCGLGLRLFISGHAIFGDGNGYYSYSQALYFQHSLNFDPIYNHLVHFAGKKYTFSRIFWNTQKGPLGVRFNAWTIGTGLIWIPSLALINLTTWLLHVPINQFNVIYELGPGLTGIVLSLSGLWFLEKYLRYFVDQATANLVILAIFLSSNLLYYITLEPALSHQPSFFLIAFLLYSTYKMPHRIWMYGGVGFLMGLLAITRMADSILLLPILWQLWTSRPSFKLITACCLGVVIGIFPQLITQYVMYGSLFHNPYFTGENGWFLWRWAPLWTTLFSIHRSLFTWSPILLIGIAGIIKKRVAIFTLIIFWMITSQWSSIGSAGFGNRFYIGALPYFALGLALIFAKLKPQSRLIIVTLFTICNVLLLNQFLVDPNRLVNDQGLTPLNFVTGQVTTLRVTFQKVFHHG